MYKVTCKVNIPIGDFRAIERRYDFMACDFWQPDGSSLVYFRLDRFNIRTESKNDIVTIETI